MPMNPEIKAQWLTDLRSGQYEQGRSFLNADGKLCCLGVLCELAVRAGVIDSESVYGVIYYDGKKDVLSGTVVAWAGLPREGDAGVVNPGNPDVTVFGEKVSLAELNDGENGWERHSFAQLADLIDQQL